MTRPDFLSGEPLLLLDALVEGTPTDVLIAAGRIVAVGDVGTRQGVGRVLDLAGYTLLPSGVEPHAHLDKALLAERVPNLTGDLAGAISAIHTAYASMDPGDVLERASRALTIAIAHGYTAVRTHVDCRAENGTGSLRVLLELRDAVSEMVDVQVVVLVGFPVTGEEGVAHRKLLDEAIDLGVDVVGGSPALDLRPALAVRTLVDAAADAGLPVDLHVDETTSPDMLTVRALAEETVRRGLYGRVTASHCISLGQQDGATAVAIAAILADAGVGVVTLPQTSLYLQGRDRPTCTPRGLTAVSALRAAGVVLAGGGDNWRDLFNPLGRIDPLETAALLVAAAHLPVADAYAAVSAAPRRLLGLPAVTIAPGSPADLLAVRAVSLADAVAGASEDRIVLRRGRVLSRTRVVQDVAPHLPLPERRTSRSGDRPEAVA